MIAWLVARWRNAPGNTLMLGLMLAAAVLLVVTIVASLTYGPTHAQDATCGRLGCWAR